MFVIHSYATTMNGTRVSITTRNGRMNKIKKLSLTEKKLARSCQSVIHLNDRIRGLTKRYNVAKEDGYRSFRYNYRVRIAVTEGVRNMYYEYARNCAEEVAELRKDLYNQNVTIVTGSDREDSDDDDEEDSLGEAEIDMPSDADDSEDDDGDATETSNV